MHSELRTRIGSFIKPIPDLTSTKSGSGFKRMTELVKKVHIFSTAVVKKLYSIIYEIPIYKDPYSDPSVQRGSEFTSYCSNPGYTLGEFDIFTLKKTFFMTTKSVHLTVV